MQFDWWVLFPSGAAKVGQCCADAWKAAGWHVGVLTDPGEPQVVCDFPLSETFRGTGRTFNRFASMLPDARGFLCINDDMFPGRNADAETFSAAFLKWFPDTFGVVQPTGDFYEAMKWCAPAPLIGAEYYRRVNGGSGPWWHEYAHLHCDQELRDVAIMLGAYAECPEITVTHECRSRGHADQLPPEKRARLNALHATDARIYRERSAARFPGHEPVA